MPYAYEYKRIKDKSGFVKLYSKSKEKNKHKKDCKCFSCRLEKYFRLNSLEFYKKRSDGKLFEVTIYDSSLLFKKSWLKYWREVLTEIHSYFSKMPEEQYSLFSDRDVMAFYMGVYGKDIEYASCEGEIELMQKYGGWYYIEFDNSFWDVYAYEDFKKYLERRKIFNMYWTHESAHLLMFFKKMTGKKLELAIKRYKYLVEVQEQMGKKVKRCKEAFFKKGRQWEKLPG